jgi:hypothetical protein
MIFDEQRTRSARPSAILYKSYRTTPTISKVERRKADPSAKKRPEMTSAGEGKL